MSKFAISLSVEVEADSFDEAYEIEADIFRKLQEHPDIVGGPYEIDVEQTDGFDEEGEDQ